MKCCVTIWAHRTQVDERINFVFLPDLRDWFQVMDVDETFGKVAIFFLEVEIAHNADESIVLYALFPC